MSENSVLQSYPQGFPSLERRGAQRAGWLMNTQSL